MSRYGASGWPPIVGIAAVDPSVVSDLLRLTGPLTVEIDGEWRTVTPENVQDEIERQRRLQREGQKVLDVHKQVVAIIGKQIIETLTTADRARTRSVVETLMSAGDRRDLLVFVPDERLFAMVDQHGWAGRIEPLPGTPTLAITFANVAFGKSS
jgi:hypothetical protein